MYHPRGENASTVKEGGKELISAILFPKGFPDTAGMTCFHGSYSGVRLSIREQTPNTRLGMLHNNTSLCGSDMSHAESVSSTKRAKEHKLMYFIMPDGFVAGLTREELEDRRWED